jgi:hypothetical protein
LVTVRYYGCDVVVLDYIPYHVAMHISLSIAYAIPAFEAQSIPRYL